MLSLYIHVPFCRKKCPYCDFYSAPPENGAALDIYTDALCARLAAWGEKLRRREVHTVYFGGGTPSVLGADRLTNLLQAAKRSFAVRADAEITAEANPADLTPGFAEKLLAAGFNRLSLGVQSGNDEELAVLGRRHDAAGARRAVETARSAGFQNISVDLMLALPRSDGRTLQSSLDYITSLEPEHISAYILKIEPGTPFAARAHTLGLPDEDAAADQYLRTVETLKKHGFAQYEISNFCRPGRESRHNLQYWRCGEYLGLGPGAHSFVEGRRFFYPRDLEAFLAGAEPTDDGEGGGFSEYAMLALRLTEGLLRRDCAARFADGEQKFGEVLERAKRLPKPLIRIEEDRIAFTAEGFLVSNTILAALLP